MDPKRTTILCWTGSGDIDSLRSSVGHVMKSGGATARVRTVGSSVEVVGPEPAGVAARLRHMPGVSWLAAGMSGGSASELAEASALLAKRYLRRGDRFTVEAESAGRVTASDLAGSMTSKVLDSVKGVRVSARSPKVKFRASFDGKEGAVGVEIAKGPGGAPTGGAQAACLVSGGRHSAVTAWFAVLLGFRVTLVHARYDEDSLLAVSRLYSELSHRADPRWLSLGVVAGGSVRRLLADYAARAEHPVFAGFHPGSVSGVQSIPGVQAPLYLLPAERFSEESGNLGVKEYDAPEDWDAATSGDPGITRFGGRAADVSEVLDRLG